MVGSWRPAVTALPPVPSPPLLQIRITNATFQRHVRDAPGGEEFMHNAGFKVKARALPPPALGCAWETRLGGPGGLRAAAGGSSLGALPPPATPWPGCRAPCAASREQQALQSHAHAGMHTRACERLRRQEEERQQFSHLLPPATRPR
mgnify:CR=1 FL=1